MNIDKTLICKRCNGKRFEVKREVTYEYTYKINTPEEDHLTENTEGLPFLFDDREKVNSHEYLLCLDCGAKYPCSLKENEEHVNFTILQRAIRADNVTNPEFLG